MKLEITCLNQIIQCIMNNKFDQAWLLCFFLPKQVQLVLDLSHPTFHLLQVSTMLFCTHCASSSSSSNLLFYSITNFISHTYPFSYQNILQLQHFPLFLLLHLPGLGVRLWPLNCVDMGSIPIQAASVYEGMSSFYTLV